MPADQQHARMISQAAKTALAPLGFRRKGHSRVWYADRGYWMLMVEFQPSSWSKGSYLNIAAHWFWSPIAWSFDYCHRADGFIRFKGKEQFEPLVAAFARTAAAEATALDKKFSSLEAIAAYTEVHTNDPHARPNPWSLYNAAIASTLTGSLDAGARYFSELLAQQPTHDWEHALHRVSAELAALASETDFALAIRQKVMHARAAIKLSKLDTD